MDSTRIIQYIVFLLFVTSFSILWGKAMPICAKIKVINTFVRYLMRFSRSNFDPIKFYTMVLLYFAVSIIGTIILCISFQFNILPYFSIKSRYIAYIFIGFVAQMSLSSLILIVIASVNTKIDWYGTIRQIPWVKLMSNLPKFIRPLYPIGGAFCEELYFRGTIFIIHITFFPDLGYILPICIVTGLFIIQQTLNTTSVIQAVVISIGATVISILGCLSILYTESFLPALICHLLFVVFYLGGSDTGKQSYSSKGMSYDKY
jgi:hypothetical protein